LLLCAPFLTDPTLSRGYGVSVRLAQPRASRSLSQLADFACALRFSFPVRHAGQDCRRNPLSVLDGRQVSNEPLLCLQRLRGMIDFRETGQNALTT